MAEKRTRNLQDEILRGANIIVIEGGSGGVTMRRRRENGEGWAMDVYQFGTGSEREEGDGLQEFLSDLDINLGLAKDGEYITVVDSSKKIERVVDVVADFVDRIEALKVADNIKAEARKLLLRLQEG